MFGVAKLIAAQAKDRCGLLVMPKEALAPCASTTADRCACGAKNMFLTLITHKQSVHVCVGITKKE